MPADPQGTSAGTVEPLTALLASQHQASQEFGALALCRLAWASPSTRDEIFTKLCSAAVVLSGSATLLAPLEGLVQGSAAALWQAAAYLAHAITQADCSHA